MKLVFLGTRGKIEARSPRHRRHSSLLVSYRRRRVMIDAGEDWLGRWDDVAPHRIVLTHAHPDHAWGLQAGTPCPVHAPPPVWDAIDAYPIAPEDRHPLRPREPVEIEGMVFEAFPVAHSVRAPAVGYRITAGRARVFYVPDVVHIHEREAALRGVDLYIGDGAALDRALVRRQADALIGHAAVATQLTWCEKEGVPEAIITHCGSPIVEGDERTLGARLRRWGRERGVVARFAYDGLERVLR